MPFLDEIVDTLNTKWVSSFNCVPGQKHAYGIAETMLVAKEDNDDMVTVRYPGVVNYEGEVEQIMVDDRIAIALYHKIDSITNTMNNKGFGDEIGEHTEVANMSLMVVAFQNLVKKPAHWIEGILKSSLPATMQFVNKQRTVVKAGNSSFDKLGLLGREYSEIELNYPTVIFFEMKYRIESTYNKKCFEDNNGC